MVRQTLIRGTNQGRWQQCGQPAEKRDEETPMFPSLPLTEPCCFTWLLQIYARAVNSYGVSLPLSQPGRSSVEVE